MLSELQKTKLPNLFNLFDMDNDGLLSERDMLRIVDACVAKRGWQTGQKDHKALHAHFVSVWENMLEAADKNNDDLLSMAEFLAFYDQIIKDQEIYQRVISGIGVAVFSTFDTNDDGQLSLDEYRDFYRVMGLDTTFAKAIYSKLDLNNDNTISIDELIQLLDQFFRSQDCDAPGNFLFGPIA